MKKILVSSIIAAIAVIFASCDSGGNSNTPSASQNTTYTLSVVKNLGNGGNVSVSVNGGTPIANPGPLPHAAGTTITVTATPASGFAFQSWTPTNGDLPAFLGGSATSSVITFRMNSHVLIRANFQATGGGTTYTLTLNRSPAEGGSVSANNLNNPAEPLSFIAGATVNLSATPANGFTFTSWTGATVASPNSATTTIQMNSNATVTANFTSTGGGQIACTGNCHLPNVNNCGPSCASSCGTCSRPGCTSTPSGPATVNTYPFPTPLPQYNGVTMTAGGQNIQLISVKVKNTHTWEGNFSNQQNNRDTIPVAMFDMSGTPQVTVSLPNTNGVVIRPRGKNITHTTAGNTITFTLPSTGQYSVEWGNGGEFTTTPKNALLIFANPIETITGTRTLGPGLYGDQTLSGGEVLVLQAGAVVRGKVLVNSNSKIVGRGIIDGSHLNNFNMGGATVLPIETGVGAANAEINGITILDPNAWAVQINESRNIRIKNLKIISSRANSDGISLQSSSNIAIEDSFIRSWDDGIVIKNYGTPTSANITARNCILWTDLAQCMEIGFETNKGERPNPVIDQITFENITVFHAMHKAPISIHNGDNAVISNVTFKNIVVENYQTGEGDGWEILIDLTNVPAGQVSGADPNWTVVTARGTISGKVEGLTVLGGKANRNVRRMGSGINVTTPF